MIRMRVLPAVLASLLLAACANDAPPPAAAPAAQTPAAPVADAAAEQAFAALSKEWLDGAMRLGPVGATQTGDHRFDGELDDLSAAGREASLAFSKQMLARLEAIDRSALSRADQVDAAILHNQLRYDIWSTETLQSWAWDPQLYSQLAGGALYTLVARDFAPWPERLRSATSRMEKLPRLFEQMRTNIDPARVPAIHAETVQKQHAGVISLVDGLLMPHRDELPEAERARFDAAVAGLRAAVEEQQTWIETQLVPNAKGDFRIGAALYDQKLAFALNSPLGRAEIRQRAEADLKRLRGEMYQVARTVLAGKPDAPALPETPSDAEQQAAIEAALELAYADRPARDKVVDVAKESLAKTTEFVRAKDLVTLPESPVEIILMPEFQRGVAVAYCDSPGPLDKHLDTFYAVSPIPDDWTDEQVASFLREYNTRSIHELTVHEAMPGHYLQLAHSNTYPSTLRGVLWSGPFVEGWAVYAEHVMVEAGYYDNDPLFKLVHLKWELRAVANAILDQAIHVDGMTREQAMELMTVKTFQQEREAAGKWVRAQLTSAQLPTYFVGAQEHYDLRRAAEAAWGKDFTLKRYHDAVLSFGSPPVRYARALLLDAPIE